MLFSDSPTAQNLRLLLEKAEREHLDVSIVSRLRVFLHFAEHQQSVTETCRFFGISRSTFHRWMDHFDPSDLSSLQDHSCEPSVLRQSVISPETVELIRRYRMRYVHMGKEKIAQMLAVDCGIELSPSTIGRIIERECLYFSDTPFHWKKRITMQKHVGAASGTAEVSSGVAQPATSLQDDIVMKPVVNLKRFLMFTTVLVNLVFIAALIGTSFYERSLFVAPSPEQASIPSVINAPPAMHAAPTFTELP